MAKRTIKPSKAKADQPEVAPETIAIPERPVEVKAEQPDAADLLDTPEQSDTWKKIAEQDARDSGEPIPATLAEPEVDQIPDHLAMLTPEQQAEMLWLRKLDDAKNDHLEASLEVERIKGELKAAKDRQKNAIELYQAIESRGPVIPKPVTPPEEQSGTQQPLPADQLGENGWRAIPITDLDLESIKGLGAKKKGKKYQALVDAIPTLGHLEDRRVAGGIEGLKSQMPDGVGDAVASPLEELHLNKIVEWRQQQGNANDTGAEMVEAGSSTHAATHSAPTPATQGGPPSFTEWELMTTGQQHGWINARAAQISETLAPLDILSANLTADFQAGGIAYGRGENVTDCPRIPGDEMDQWLARYFDAARDDEASQLQSDGDVSMAGGEPELVAAVIGSPAYSDLDDI